MTIPSEPHKKGQEGNWITRERLASGEHMALRRARADPSNPLKSDAEIEASLDAALAQHPAGADVWLFGYGSLMWNPAFLFEERRVGTLAGWHRRFCLKLMAGRGSPERPGLMLALDSGGACSGVLFRIAAAQARDELLLVWRREMAGDSYRAPWVDIACEGGPIRALTFVVNPAQRRYVGCLPDEEVAQMIAHARGELGTCAAYLQQTAEALRLFEVVDDPVERLLERVEAIHAEMADDAV